MPSTNRQGAIEILQDHAEALRARGVTHAALFGSVARGEGRSDSDLDIMIELDPAAKLDLFDYAAIRAYIETLFPGRVDVVDKAALKPELRNPIAADAIYAF
jgi:predicted nucleotidyltransferase